VGILLVQRPVREHTSPSCFRGLHPYACDVEGGIRLPSTTIHVRKLSASGTA
jgi:hypothetical protein